AVAPMWPAPGSVDGTSPASTATATTTPPSSTSDINWPRDRPHSNIEADTRDMPTSARITARTGWSKSTSAKAHAPSNAGRHDSSRSTAVTLLRPRGFAQEERAKRREGDRIQLHANRGREQLGDPRRDVDADRRRRQPLWGGPVSAAHRGHRNQGGGDDQDGV